MDITDAVAFLGDHHHAVLGTTSPSGRTQLTPVIVVPGGDDVVLLSTRESTVKTANLRRTGRATLLVLSDTFFGPFVQLEGAVEVISMPESLDGLIAYYRAASGEHPDWEEYAAAMAREQRVLVRITVEWAGPSRQG